MEKIKRIVTVSMLGLIAQAALAYSPVKHGIISDFAVQQSELNNPSNRTLEKLGLGITVDDKRFLLPSTSSNANTLTPMRLIRRGAIEEDEGFRAFNHFFDPQNGGRRLTVPELIIVPHYPSPDWSLEDLYAISAQEFSYKDALDYLFQGLTSPITRGREKNMGRMFEALGHITHRKLPRLVHNP